MEGGFTVSGRVRWYISAATLNCRNAWQMDRSEIENESERESV